MYIFGKGIETFCTVSYLVVSYIYELVSLTDHVKMQLTRLYAEYDTSD